MIYNLGKLTHGICVLAWYLVIADFYSRRNVLSIVSAKARVVLETLSAVWFFSGSDLEIVSGIC